jgi:UDP-glucose 4-epimerase
LREAGSQGELSNSSRSILVTGANGLLGRATLARFGPVSCVYALTRTVPPTPLPANATHILHDLRQRDDPPLPEAPDTIIHLAQSSRFRDFPDGAAEVFEVNTGSTQRLLDWAHRIGVRRFIYASTGGLYGHGEHAFQEDEPIDGVAVRRHYFASKRCGELLVQSYAASMIVVVLRFFFAYGPGQAKTMLMASLIDRVIDQQAIVLQGSDGFRFNPICASDAAAAIGAAASLESSETINVAGTEIVSLREVATTIGDLLGHNPRFELRPDESDKDLIGCTGKMKRLLGEPKVPIRLGLQRMIDSDRAAKNAAAADAM